MLINLSNHPFEKWEEKHQQAAFRQFGIVEDLVFPDVDPNADTDAISQLATEYLSVCLTKLETTDGNKDAIHISGEPCFLFQFVTLAKAHGILCVCSTTQRLVTNNGNIKTTIFKFNQFRTYF